MEISKKTLGEIQQRVEKLRQLEEELIGYNGLSISITRLTILKSLCKDSLAMCEFAYEISKKTKPRIIYKEENKKVEKVVNESIKVMGRIIKASKLQNKLIIAKDEENQINQLSRELWKYQDEIIKVKWSNVRIVKDREIILIEESLDCFKYSEDPKRGYDLGRSYTERYNPSQGTGLISESQEYVKEIREFWEKYYKRLIKN